jgi:hypothetical protein
MGNALLHIYLVTKHHFMFMSGTLYTSIAFMGHKRGTPMEQARQAKMKKNVIKFSLCNLAVMTSNYIN